MASLNFFYLYQIGIPFTYIKCVIIVETYFGTDDRIHILEKGMANQFNILALRNQEQCENVKKIGH